MNDQESPEYGSSKSRSGAGFSFLRGRRSGDSDGLISFNLMPQESTEEDAPPVPGRVSPTRLLMVHYWRRDQRAMAEAEQRLADAAAALALDSDLSSGSSQPASALPPHTPSPAALPMETTPAAAAQAPMLDPNRPDFLSSLKSRQRPSVSAPAEAAWSPLVIELPSSTKSAGETGEAARDADLGASLFVEPGAPPAPAAEKPRSIFEPQPRETVSAPTDAPSVFARAEADPQPIVEPLVAESPAALTNEPAAELVTEPEPVSAHEPEPVSAHASASQGRQAKIRALESFLKRVEQRRQQIESQSVA